MKKKNLTEKELLLTLHQKYLKDPVIYCKEVLGIQQLWKLQEDLLAACPVAIKERKQIYVASGHSLGKDYISAAIGLWYLQTHIPSIVIQTAPTDRQVKSIMWKETQTHWLNKRIDLGGKAFVEPRIEVAKDWYLIGFTTKETGATKEGGGGKFQGFHSPNICVIVTEAQAIEDNIYDQIDAVTSSEDCLVIYIGNPTRAKGRFAAGLRDRTRNMVFNFSCLDNPNYCEKRTVIPGLASYEWVEDKRLKWGEGGKKLFHAFRTSQIKELIDKPPVWLQIAWKISRSRETGHKKEMILKAWRIFKADDKLPMPNANSPDANRHMYYSMQQMADKLGIAYATYNINIRPQILKMFEAEKKLKKELMNRLIEKGLEKMLNGGNNAIELTPESIPDGI